MSKPIAYVELPWEPTRDLVCYVILRSYSILSSCGRSLLKIALLRIVYFVDRLLVLYGLPRTCLRWVYCRELGPWSPALDEILSCLSPEGITVKQKARTELAEADLNYLELEKKFGTEVNSTIVEVVEVTEENKLDELIREAESRLRRSYAEYMINLGVHCEKAEAKLSSVMEIVEQGVNLLVNSPELLLMSVLNSPEVEKARRECARMGRHVEIDLAEVARTRDYILERFGPPEKAREVFRQLETVLDEALREVVARKDNI